MKSIILLALLCIASMSTKAQSPEDIRNESDCPVILRLVCGCSPNVLFSVISRDTLYPNETSFRPDFVTAMTNCQSNNYQALVEVCLLNSNCNESNGYCATYDMTWYDAPNCDGQMAPPGDMSNCATIGHCTGCGGCLCITFSAINNFIVLSDPACAGCLCP